MLEQPERHPRPTAPGTPLKPGARGIRLTLASISAALAATLITPQVQAAEAASSLSRRTYDIPGGPLGSAVAAYAAQAGVNLSANLASLEGMRTQGLTGPYAVEEGFARLLASSGWRARSLGQGNYVLEAAADMPLVTPPVTAKHNKPTELQATTVSSTRLAQSSNDSPQNIKIISHEEIEAQQAFTSSTTQILSNLIPSMPPSMQKMSNYGQTMRGLQPLVLVDGIPQSSPMYTSIGRDMGTIDPAMIDRIEVIQGASASNGIGGMGGVINIITLQPRGGKPHQHISAELTSPTSRLAGEALSYKTTYGISGSDGAIDYLFNASYQSQGAFFDGSDRRIGTYDAQGDLMDSKSYDVMGKLGYWIDEDQNIALSVNRYEIKNNNRYSLVSGNRGEGVPSTSTKDTPPGSAPYNDAWTVGASYDHYDFNGMKINAVLYYQTVDSMFRGNTRFLNNNTYDQSHAEFDKVGAKFSVTSPGFLDDSMRATVGLDMMHEKSSQSLLYSKLAWVPNIVYNDVSPFAQLEYSPTSTVKILGGVRHERANIDVDSFTTLPRYGSRYVEGADLSFGKTLYNFGASWSPLESLNLFANYSQGFKVPDMGKAIRGISVNGAKLSEVSYFEPDIADNYEVGLRINKDKLALQASYFHTTVKPGTVISYSNDQWVANRYRSEIDGVELAATYQLTDKHQAGLSYSHSQGRYDLDGDSKVDTKLDGSNIAPDRLGLSWNASWSERLSSLVQANWYMKRSFDGNNVVNTYAPQDYHFSGYVLVDAAMGYSLPYGKLTFGVSNLLDKQYITYYSQSAIVGDDYYFSGQGRTATVGYRYDF